MILFEKWLNERGIFIEVNDNATFQEIFIGIIDNPTDLQRYLVATDFLEENGLDAFAQLIRLCISYVSASGHEKARITKQIGLLYKQNQHILDKINTLSYNHNINQIIYSLQTNDKQAYTYDSMRDRRNWVNDQPPKRFASRDDKDHAFINSTYTGFKTGSTIDTFPPEIIAAMLLHILLATNPTILSAIRRSKTLFALHPFGHVFHSQDTRNRDPNTQN